VPYVAKDAKHLYVFQRTPSYVWERGNRPTDPNWAKTLKPGWQWERMENFDAIMEGEQRNVDLVDDGWTALRHAAMAKIFYEGADLSPDAIMQRAERADFESGVAMRARVDQIVTNPAAAEGLKPWFKGLCKRPTMNDEYLPAFNRPNVTLVDTRGLGVERITPRGVVANGVEYEVDCIIFATGFDTGQEITKRAEFEVYGVDGQTLTEHHRKAPRTYHGFYSHGFPNFFFLGISQNGFKANFTHMLVDQLQHITPVIAELVKRGKTRLEPTAQAEEDWQTIIRTRTKERRASLETCTPGYYNGQGDVDHGFFANIYGGGGSPGSREFTGMMADWRARGDMAGMDVG
jgi:cyclohexanone monooxygenase